MKKAIYFAGTYGAGKSLLIESQYFFSPRKNPPDNYICQDRYKYEFDKMYPLQEEDNTKRAAIRVARQLTNYINKGETYYYEVAALGDTAPYRKAKAAGFEVVVNFVYVYPVEKTLDRIVLGVGKGTRHDIKHINAEDQRRKQAKLLQDISWHIKSLDTVRIFDNSGDWLPTDMNLILQEMAVFKNGKCIFLQDGYENVSNEFSDFINDHKEKTKLVLVKKKR